MDAEDIIIGGAVLFWLGVLYFNQQQQQSSFAGFMDSIGGNDFPPGPDLVPVNDTDSSQSQPVSVLTSISDWAKATFGFECGSSATCKASRNNNPGNLKFAGQPGAVPSSDGFAVFPSLDAGYAALNRQLTKTLNEQPSLTLTQFYARYLGQSDYLTPKITSQGDPFAYASKVAADLGVSPNQTIGSIFGGH